MEIILSDIESSPKVICFWAGLGTNQTKLVLKPGLISLLSSPCCGAWRIIIWGAVFSIPALLIASSSSASYPAGSSACERLVGGREEQIGIWLVFLFFFWPGKYYFVWSTVCLHVFSVPFRHFWISFYSIFLEAETWLLTFFWFDCVS